MPSAAPPRPAWGRPWKCIPQNSCVSGSESRRASPGPESRPCITSEGWAARAPDGAPRVYRTRPGLWKPKAVSEEGEQGSVPETRRREGRRTSSPLKQREPGTRRRNWGRRDAQKVLSSEKWGFPLLSLRGDGWEVWAPGRLVFTPSQPGRDAGGGIQRLPADEGPVAVGASQPCPPVWQRQPRRFADEQAWLASNKALFMRAGV